MRYLRNLFTVLGYIVNHPANKGHSIKAVVNFVRWQLGTLLLEKKIIVPWVDEAKFITGKGETGLTFNIYAGFTEFNDMSFLIHALSPSDYFVDIGANVGAYTILASKVVGAHSMAFEPLPETFERLQDQLYINRIDQMVDARNEGVGDKQETLQFTNNMDTVNKVSLSNLAHNTTQVGVVTLDSVEYLSTGTEALFLKIDVEGYEYNVIEGAKNILSSTKVFALIIELNGSGQEFGHSDKEIHAKLVSFGLIPASYDPFSRSLKILDSFNSTGGNTIYVRDPGAIAARCKVAPTCVVHTANGLRV